MKLNLEIQIDWLDEDHTLDDVVKQEIIESIIGKLDKKVYENIETKVNQVIDNTVVQRINELTEKMFQDFTSRQITLSDKYGDTLKVYSSLTDLIKERFDNFMTEKVDDNGKTTKSSYGRTSRRIDFIINKRLKDFADNFTKDAVSQVQKEIKLHVEQGLKEHMGNKMMEVLDIPKLLKLAEPKK